MLRLVSTCTLSLLFLMTLRAEVVVIDGEDYLLLPADLVAGDQFARDSLRWARPYEIDKEGRHQVTAVYQRIYQFDEETLEKIHSALHEFEHAYFKYIHESKSFKQQADGTILITVINTRTGMKNAMDAYTRAINTALNDKQKKILKYYKLLDFFNRDNFSKTIILSEQVTTISLILPAHERPLAPKEAEPDEHAEKIAALEKKLEQARADWQNGTGDEKELTRLSRQLRQLETRQQAQTESYMVNIQHGEEGRSSTGSSTKPGEFIFFERAWRFHVDGSQNDDAAKDQGTKPAAQDDFDF